jgi:superfamily I DNA/RNA helicase
MFDELTSLIAAFNDGANKGFWRIQLRDNKGQWAEMGRGLLSKVRMPDGSIQDQRGVYIGASERNGYGRQLVLEDDGKYYIYDIKPSNLTQFDATIPDEVLKQQGISKKARTPSIAEQNDPDIQDLADMNRREATEADVKLATDVPDEGQKAIIAAEREKSPVANLPAGAEGKLSDDELKDLIESPTAQEAAPEKTSTPAAKEPKAKRIVKASRKAIEEAPDGAEFFYSRRGKLFQLHMGPDGYLYKGPYIEDKEYTEDDYFGSYDEIVEANDIGRGPGNIYKGPIPRDENNNPLTALEFSNLMSEQAAAAKAVKNAVQKIDSGEKVNLDDIIKDANSDGPIMNDALDDIDLDEISFFDEDTPTEAPEPEAVAPEKKKPVAKKPAVSEPSPEDEEPAGIVDSDVETPDLPAEQTTTADDLGNKTEEAPAKSKISMEELDAMGTPEEYVDDFGGFTPSQEQTRALNAIVKGKNSVVIDALAGAGKTTTLIAAARAIGRTRPDEGVLIITFNKKNADEAAAKSPKENTDGRTSHSLAFQALNAPQRKILLKPNVAAVISRDSGTANSPGVAEHLGIEDTLVNGENKTPEEVAGIVQKAIVNFSNSADKKIEEKHFGSVLAEIGNPEVEHKFNPKLLEYADKFWADVTSDQKLGYYDKDSKKFVGKRRLRVTQDHSLKMWSLSEPDLSQLKVRGKPVKVVFFDEAQDTNPAVADVIKKNKDKVQIAYVGDPNQAIYGFRGAENAIDDAKKEVDVIVDLTMTRRFGDGLTDPANAFLNLIGARRRIKGVGSGGEVLPESEMPFGTGRAHLVRTNSGGVESILSYLENGKNVGVLSVYYEDVKNAVYNLKWLAEDFDTVDDDGKKVKRSPMPKDPQGNVSWSDDFFGMRNKADFYKMARKDSKSKAAKWVKLLDKIDADENNLTEKLEQMLEQVVIDKSDQPAYGGDFSGEIGSDGILWSSRSGKSLSYSIDEDGNLKISGNASFESVNGKQIKDLIKERGFKFFGERNGHDNTWRLPLIDEQTRKEAVAELLSNLPVEKEENTKESDVIISTAHRSKGLEWDYVSIGDDFFAPKTNLETGKLVVPDKDELKLSYVALSRARKGLSVGSLDWGMEYQGREGLAKANDLLKRSDGYGSDAWDYHDKLFASPSTPSSSDQILNDITDLDFDNIIFFDEDSEETVEEEVNLEINAPAGFLDGWSQTQGGDYSKNVDGFRWSIKENKDGTVTVRPRTDPSLGTTKYNSMEEAEKAFPALSEKGLKSNRDKLKSTVATFDESGEIQKAIDEGKSADEVNSLIQKSDNWIQAIDEGKANFLSLRAGLERVGNGNVEINNPKTKKPKDISKKKITPTPPTPDAASSFYNDNPDRQDDGSDVGRISINDKAMRKLRAASKPDDVKRAAFAINPEAMVQPDGSIVVYRGTHLEEVGPAEGETRQLEISFKDNRDASFTTIIKVTNPETGETKEYWHYAPKHSFAALMGSEDTESAGVQRLLSNWFFRDIEANPYSKDPTRNQEMIDRFGGIEGSIAKFRSGNFEKIMSNKKSDDRSFKLRTPKEHTEFALNGRDTRLNNSLQNWWTVGRKERGSIFEALDGNDASYAAALFRTYQNSIPDTKEARDVVERYLSSAIAQKFPLVRGSQIKSMLSNAMSQVKSELPETGLPVRPHMSRDGVQLKGGDLVQWTDNVQGTVVGQVSFLQRVENPDDGKYSYSDFAVVNFADGTSERLNTKNMTLAASAEDVAGDPNMLENMLTEYSGWVRRDDLKIERAELAGWTFDPISGNFYDSDNNIVDTLGKFDDRSDTYSGEEDGEADGPEDTPTKAVEDLEAGEILVDTETGEDIGTVSSTKSGTLPDGREITVVFLEDGSNKKYLTGDEVSIKSQSAPSTPEPSTPVRPARPAVGDAAKETAALELGTPPGESPKKTLSKNSSTDESAKVAIKGDANRKALRPTQEATDAKNKILAAGAKVWAEVKPKVVDKLKAAGYDVSSGDYNDIIKQNEANRSATAKARIKAERALDKYEERFGTDNTAKREQLAKAAIDAQIEVEKANTRARKIYDEIKIAERDATVEVLKSQGVNFDNVSIAEFNNRVLTDEARLPIGPNDQFISATALREAFDFMPENVIRGLANYLETNNLTLSVKAGVERGHFRQVPGGFEIVLSSNRRGAATSDLNKATDVALHELWHFVQKTDPNLRQIEDAWAFDRIVMNPGTPEETMPNIMSLDRAGREKTFAAPGIAQPYMLKQYAGGSNFLDSNDGHSEVTTVLMQDMFTSPGFASRGNGLNVITKDPETKKKSTIRNAYYDPETGMYYEDSSMSNPIENVVGSFGRDVADGTDEDMKSLGMGILMALTDWDPLTGFGPGNAVVENDEE